MSTFILDMRAALDAQLNTLSGTPIAWENRNYAPNPTTEYIEPFFLPAETSQAGMGSDGLDLSIGIYQININTPINKGRSQITDSIADLFKRGTILTKNDVKIRITAVYTSRSQKSDVFYITPIDVRYQVFTEPRV